MSGRTILLLALALIAGSLGFLKYRLGNISPSPQTTTSPAPTPTPPSTTNWLTLTTDYFSLSYPPEASAAAVSSGIDSQEWRVNYMGNLQKESGRTQTELWDGYAITITRFESVGENPVTSQAETDRENIVNGCGAESATAITESTLNQIKTVSFEGGCLGSAVYHYFVEGNAVFRITNFIAKPANQTLDYQQLTNQILSTLTLQ